MNVQEVRHVSRNESQSRCLLHLCWDLEHLFHEVVAGMKKCGELGRVPVSMGIDTWGVDFVLLDVFYFTISSTTTRTAPLVSAAAFIFSVKPDFEKI